MLIRTSFVLALVAAALSASAQVKYSLTNLDANGIDNFYTSSGSTSPVASSRAYAVNNAGQVSGVAIIPNLRPPDGEGYAFVYSNGAMRALDDIDPMYHGYAINEAGQVTGDGYGDLFRTWAYLTKSNGGQVEWRVGTYSRFGSTFAYGVNNLGQFVGMGQEDLPGYDSGPYHAILGKSGQYPPKDLGTLDPTYDQGFSAAYGINDKGAIVGVSSIDARTGTRAFYYTEAGGMRALPTLGGNEGIAYAVNEAGRVAGGSQTASGATHAFLSGPDGGNPSDLGTLGGASSTAYGLNETDAVVGTSTNAAGQNRAFVFTPGTGMRDLTSLLDLTGAGWTLTEARGISDTGFIVGSGLYNGQVHSFLLTPQSVPEPATMAALGLGALAVLRRRRK